MDDGRLPPRLQARIRRGTRPRGGPFCGENARMVAASTDPANNKRVVVSTRDGSGAGTGNPADAPFYLTVNC